MVNNYHHNFSYSIVVSLALVYSSLTPMLMCVLCLVAAGYLRSVIHCTVLLFVAHCCLQLIDGVRTNATSYYCCYYN